MACHPVGKLLAFVTYLLAGTVLAWSTSVGTSTGVENSTASGLRVMSASFGEF